MRFKNGLEALAFTGSVLTSVLHVAYYVCAPLFIIGEAFIGLRYLPTDTYQVPSWLRGWHTCSR
jgi:hypothetical protein